MWILNKRLNGKKFLHHSRGKNFLTPRGIIPRGVSFFYTKYEYLGENEAKNENILTHWSVTQASSNYDWGSKVSLDCPFKI